jgi:DNA repair protein RadC
MAGMTQLSFIAYAPPALPALPQSDRPIRRVCERPADCNASELLAALIGGPKQVELAQAVLAKYDGSLYELLSASAADLMEINGIGEATAARLVAAIRLALMATRDQHCRTPITSPADVFKFVSDMQLLEQEEVRVVMLDVRNNLLGVHMVYRGSLNTTMIRVGELFREAIKRNAASIILVHNHPSGDPSPSPDDAAVTRMAVEAGKLIDIALHDHLVVGRNRFVSLKERNVGF